MKHSHCQHRYSDLSQYQLIECRELLEEEELHDCKTKKDYLSTNHKENDHLSIKYITI